MKNSLRLNEETKADECVPSQCERKWGMDRVSLFFPLDWRQENEEVLQMWNEQPDFFDVRPSRKGVVVNGSLPKLRYGHNMQGLPFEELPLCLDAALSLFRDRKEDAKNYGTLLAVEMCTDTTVDTAILPNVSLNGLAVQSSWRSEGKLLSVSFHQKQMSFYLYDKVAEANTLKERRRMAERGLDVASLLSENVHGVRLEKRFKKHIGEQIGMGSKQIKIFKFYEEEVFKRLQQSAEMSAMKLSVSVLDVEATLRDYFSLLGRNDGKLSPKESEMFCYCYDVGEEDAEQIVSEFCRLGVWCNRMDKQRGAEAVRVACERKRAAKRVAQPLFQNAMV